MILKFEDIKIDKEFQELLPVLTMDEYEKLEQDILKYGMLDPIKVWQDPESKEWVIVDGHNRYPIMKKYNIDFNIENVEDFLGDDCTRSDVMQWMKKFQNARRNLSDAERIYVEDKISKQKIREENERRKIEGNSLGGKGGYSEVSVHLDGELNKNKSHTSPTHTREQRAKNSDVSTGTIARYDAVMKSDDEEIKEKLRKKVVSIDKAYQEIKNPKVHDTIEATPQKRIEKIDNRMNDIDKEISSLRIEKEALMRKRSIIFESLDIDCELKCEFVENSVSVFGLSKNCRFYIEFNGHKKIFVECCVFVDTEPDSFYLNKVPEKYKNDFIMLWKKAHEEDVKDFNDRTAKWSSQFKNGNNNSVTNEENKGFYKKCFRILAKNFHPDNSDGSMEDMQNLNELKVMWEI